MSSVFGEAEFESGSPGDRDESDAREGEENPHGSEGDMFGVNLAGGEVPEGGGHRSRTSGSDSRRRTCRSAPRPTPPCLPAQSYTGASLMIESCRSEVAIAPEGRLPQTTETSILNEKRKSVLPYEFLLSSHWEGDEWWMMGCFSISPSLGERVELVAFNFPLRLLHPSIDTLHRGRKLFINRTTSCNNNCNNMLAEHGLETSFFAVLSTSGNLKRFPESPHLEIKEPQKKIENKQGTDKDKPHPGNLNCLGLSWYIWNALSLNLDKIDFCSLNLQNSSQPQMYQEGRFRFLCWILPSETVGKMVAGSKCNTSLVEGPDKLINNMKIKRDFPEIRTTVTAALGFELCLLKKSARTPCKFDWNITLSLIDSWLILRNAPSLSPDSYSRPKLKAMCTYCLARNKGLVPKDAMFTMLPLLLACYIFKMPLSKHNTKGLVSFIFCLFKPDPISSQVIQFGQFTHHLKPLRPFVSMLATHFGTLHDLASQGAFDTYSEIETLSQLKVETLCIHIDMAIQHEFWKVVLAEILHITAQQGKASHHHWPHFFIFFFLHGSSTSHTLYMRIKICRWKICPSLYVVIQVIDC
ncbi:hypothetical protein VP01_1880g2 [Puccinia sorghi]|uniref:Uncharacterized protein n=1 Tax=Puccinia sorghi TaxID=27349 RepID=A0A0L6VDL2_9BASI|nr:hypothetical protein VP01_1880g2 [Puccinia sorghi]